MPRKPSRARQLGVTDEEYERLLNEQDGHCRLCPNKPKTRRLHVDHDHLTGEVRSLLCHRCNRNLPTWVDEFWLCRAAVYLEPACAGYKVGWIGDPAHTEQYGRSR